MAGFSFVNGWVDAVCILRYRAFATMMVGNMLKIGNTVPAYLVGLDDQSMSWLPDPVFYIMLIVFFMFGVSLYRILERGFGWSAKHFAPAVVLWITLHDVLEDFSGVGKTMAPNRFNVLRLAPVFGLQDALCVKNGFGSLPWCTTNNVVTIAFAASDVVLGGATSEEKAKLVSSLVMMVSMISGAILGSCFDAGVQFMEGVFNVESGLEDYDIAVIAPFLGYLFWLTDRIFAQAPKSARPAGEALLSPDTEHLPAERPVRRAFTIPLHKVESTLRLAG